MKPAGQKFKHSYPLTILESHLDTFGHVNHATYLQILEQARWELITGRAYGLKHIQEIAQGPVVLEVKIQFKRELFLRQNVVVQTELLSLNRKIATILQVILNEQGKVAVLAEFKFGLCDFNTRKLITPTPAWLHAIAADEQGDPSFDETSL